MNKGETDRINIIIDYSKKIHNYIDIHDNCIKYT